MPYLCAQYTCSLMEAIVALGFGLGMAVLLAWWLR